MIAIVTGSPFGSVAPLSVTMTSLWFGAHRSGLSAATALQTGGAFAGFTTVASVSELLPGTGSCVVEVAEAVFERSASVVGVTLIETLALPPFAIVPSAQVTVPLACEHVPWEGVAEPKVTPAGSVSVTVTPWAALGRARVGDAQAVGQQLAGQHRVGRVGLGEREVGRGGRRPGSRPWPRWRSCCRATGSAVEAGPGGVGDRAV